MSGGRGAGEPPLTYAGEHDMALTYVPRQVVKVGSTAYLATAVSTGEDPATTPTSWLPLGGGDSEVRVLNLLAFPDVASLGTATQATTVPYAAALARGYQDTSGTFMFSTSGHVSIGWEADGGAVSAPSFGSLRYYVIRMADSNGNLLAPTVREEMSLGEAVSYDSGTGLATGTGHTGTLFHVNPDDFALYFDVAGLYHVYVSLSWV